MKQIVVDIAVLLGVTIGMSGAVGLCAYIVLYWSR
jgi:hypothetical protein